jgi:hypothetical protein
VSSQLHSYGEDVFIAFDFAILDHAVHWKVNEAPIIDDHVPELQLKQDVEPAEAYNPALHDLH